MGVRALEHLLLSPRASRIRSDDFIRNAMKHSELFPIEYNDEQYKEFLMTRRAPGG